MSVIGDYWFSTNWPAVCRKAATGQIDSTDNNDTSSIIAHRLRTHFLSKHSERSESAHIFRLHPRCHCLWLMGRLLSHWSCPTQRRQIAWTNVYGWVRIISESILGYSGANHTGQKWHWCKMDAICHLCCPLICQNLMQPIKPQWFIHQLRQVVNWIARSVS